MVLQMMLLLMLTIPLSCLMVRATNEPDLEEPEEPEKKKVKLSSD